MQKILLAGLIAALLLVSLPPAAADPSCSTTPGNPPVTGGGTDLCDGSAPPGPACIPLGPQFNVDTMCWTAWTCWSGACAWLFCEVYVSYDSPPNGVLHSQHVCLGPAGDLHNW